MPASITELREQARLFEAELSRQASVSDAIDAEAGVATGFAGVLVGLLVQLKHVNSMLHIAIYTAFVAAGAGVVAAFPRLFKRPDPDVTSDLYDRLPETDAIVLLTKAPHPWQTRHHRNETGGLDPCGGLLGGIVRGRSADPLDPSGP